MIASHIIFGCYGFWLPNDPRGSWSDYIRNRKLFEYGGPNRVCTTASHAQISHDPQQRRKAMHALSKQKVVLNGIQARAAAIGFAKAWQQSGYVFYACSIMPDHVHVVVEVHKNAPKQIMGHLKGNATHEMIEEGIHPLSQQDDPPSPWARGGWSVYLDTDDEVYNAIHYVEQNPLKAGLKAQTWTFVKKPI